MSAGVSFSSRIYEGLFLASLWVFPALFGSTHLWSFSAAAVLLFTAFSLFWFDRRTQGGRVLRTDLDRPLALYTAVFTVSMIFSRLPYFSLLELYKLTAVLLAFLATRYLCAGRPQIYRLAQNFVFLGAFLSGLGLLQFVGGFPKGWWSHANFLSATYVNHNHFAGFLVLVLPITFGLFLAERDRSKKILFLFLGSLMGVAFVFALSRGAFISLGLAMACMVTLLHRRRLVSSATVPFLVFLVLVVGAVVVFGTESIEQRIENIRLMKEEEELSLQFRWLTWAGTLPMILRFFWLGSGPGTFGHLFLQFRPEGGFSMRPVHAHNDFLELAAEGGVLLFSAAAWLGWVFFRQGLRIVRRDESRLRIGVGSGILAGMLGLLIHGLFDFNFHIPANWLLSAVAAGLLFSMDEEKVYDPGPAARALGIGISALLPAAGLAAVYLGVSDYRLWEARQLTKLGETRGALLAVEHGLRLNPYEAEFHYLRGSLLSSGKAPSAENLRRAVKDFEEAIRRNPYEPAYDFAKASKLAPSLAERAPEKLVELFGAAVAKDPNNPTVGFLVAKETFGRDHASAALREAAGRMLSARRETLAGLVDFIEKSGLWGYHRKYHLKLAGADPDALKREASPEQWTKPPAAVYTLDDFSSSIQEPAHRGELWFRSCTFSRKIGVSAPRVRVVFRAKGSAVRAVYPAVYVRIDGRVVDEYYVDSDSYKNYYTDLALAPGEHVLALHYANDVSVGPLARQDRNVWVQRVSLLEI